MTPQELRDKVMRPPQAKTEAEVATRLEEWAEANVELEAVDNGHQKLPQACQVAAIREMLIGNSKEHIDLRLASQDVEPEALIKDIRRYAGVRRAEARQQRKGPNAMGIGDVGNAG